MYEFDYHRATSLADAAKAFAGAREGKYLAGGMTLLPTMKLRLAQPSDLIDLAGIGDLAGIRKDRGAIVIKAMTSHAAVAANKEVAGAIPALAALAESIGDPQVRNRGTIGGSLANNDPAADYPAAVLGLGATVVTDKRRIAADDFFTGMFSTALAEGELITELSFPVAKAACYVKFPNPASRYAIVGVLVARTDAGVRVAVTGAAPCVFRLGEWEKALDKSFAAESVAALAVKADDLNGDIHASAEYRAHLVGVMTRRAIAGCL